MGLGTDMREKINLCRILCGKIEENGPLLRPRHRWGDDIKWIFKN
jgi:hypothetical protein